MVLSVVTGSLMEKEHIGIFYGDFAVFYGRTIGGSVCYGTHVRKQKERNNRRLVFYCARSPYFLTYFNPIMVALFHGVTHRHIVPGLLTVAAEV